MSVTETIARVCNALAGSDRSRGPARPPPCFSELLPYVSAGETAVRGREGGFIVLNDGSIGAGFSLSPIAHESLSEGELERLSTALVDICARVALPEMTTQILWSSVPDDELAEESDSFIFKRMRNERLHLQARLGMNASFRQMRRSVHLFLRSGGMRLKAPPKPGARAHFRNAEKEFAERFAVFHERLELAAELLRQDGFRAHFLTSADIVRVISLLLGDKSASPIRSALDNLDLASTLGRHSLREEDGTLRLEGTANSLAVYSWKSQPTETAPASLATLLARPEEMHVVLTLRTGLSSTGLEIMNGLLRHATDAHGEAQRADARKSLDALARGKTLFGATLSVLVQTGAPFSAHAFAETLSRATGINFIHERHALVAFYLALLPFGCNSSVSAFCGREKRALPETISHILPLWRGFEGHENPLQVMVSRGGERIHLNPLDAGENPHLAILAPSGSGKSFYVQNLISSFFATHPKGYVFVIDKKTSYGVLAQVVSENGRAHIHRPPESLSNPFSLGSSDFALASLVSLIAGACELADPTCALRLVERELLAHAIRLAFAAKEQDSSVHFENGILVPTEAKDVPPPVLSDVLAQLERAAHEKEIPERIVESLSQKLAAFLSGQLYGNLFDRAGLRPEAPDSATSGPEMWLYDLDAVSGETVQRVLTAQIVLLEILRIIRLPENHSRPGLLIIEEAGVLAAENEELVSFIRDAWKTFRKLGIACVGISNQVEDFQRPGGPQVMWEVSSNKLVLRLDGTELEKAALGNPKEGRAPLITDKEALRLAATLRVSKGEWSQGLWMSPKGTGTFVFFPTAYDVWCGASRPADVARFEKRAQELGSSTQALIDLAEQQNRKEV